MPAWNQTTANQSLRPHEYTNNGYVQDRTLQTQFSKDEKRSLASCSMCGEQCKDVMVESKDIVAGSLVEATQFCSRACASNFCLAALTANGFAHHNRAIQQRIQKAFDVAENESRVRVVTRVRPNEHDMDAEEVTPLCQQDFPTLPPYIKDATSSSSPYSYAMPSVLQRPWAGVPGVSLAAVSSSSPPQQH